MLLLLLSSWSSAWIFFGCTSLLLLRSSFASIARNSRTTLSLSHNTQNVRSTGTAGARCDKGIAADWLNKFSSSTKWTAARWVWV